MVKYKSIQPKMHSSTSKPIGYLLNFFLFVSIGLFAVSVLSRGVHANDAAEISSSSDFLDIKVAGDIPNREVISTFRGGPLGFLLASPFDLSGTNIAQAIRVRQIGRNNSFHGATINSLNSQIASTQIGEENLAIANIIDSKDSIIIQTQIGNQNVSNLGILAGNGTEITNLQIGENRNNNLVIISKPGTKFFILSVGR